MCKRLEKFAKINATVKQLAGNKRTQKDESIRSTRRRGRTIEDQQDALQVMGH
jgi:hypothetical protein